VKIEGKEDEEIRELIGKIEGLLGDSKEYRRVVNSLKGITGELREIIGLEVEEEAGKEELLAILEETRSLVEEALSLYKKAEYDEAEELVVEAYLENYELVENAIASIDPELNEEIERLLREELRFKIVDRAPESEVEALVMEILEKLEQAEELLAGADRRAAEEAVETTTIVVETPGGLGVVGKTALAGLAVLAVAELAIILKLLRRSSGEG
jgi:hypothetical protein